MMESSSAVTVPDSRKTEITPSSDFDAIVGHFVQNEWKLYTTTQHREEKRWAYRPYICCNNSSASHDEKSILAIRRQTLRSYDTGNPISRCTRVIQKNTCKLPSFVTTALHQLLTHFRNCCFTGTLSSNFAIMRSLEILPHLCALPHYQVKFTVWRLCS